jgi:hypothetical protein
MFFFDLPTHKDENKAICLKCGWLGIVHDLLPLNGDKKYPS